MNKRIAPLDLGTLEVSAIDKYGDFELEIDDCSSTYISIDQAKQLISFLQEQIGEPTKNELSDAYHGGWRRSKKYAKETNFHGINREETKEYFNKWYKEHYG